jgi:hypothetical protein
MEQMDWLDTLDSCTKNAVQVGANPGKKIGQ